MAFVVWTKTLCWGRAELQLWLEHTKNARMDEVVIATKNRRPYGPPAGGA